MNKVFFERKPNTKRIILKFKFSKKIQSVIKQVDRSAFFNNNEKYWEGDAKLLKSYVNSFKKNNIYFKLTELMATYLNVNINGQTAEEIQNLNYWLSKHPSNALDSNTFDEKVLCFREGFNLFGYQKAGIEFIINHNGRALLADEMGLGKTVQAIGAAKYYQNDWPVVVVAPSSLIFNWKKEFLQWLPELKEEDINVIKKGSQKPKRKITICSYGYASKNYKKLQNYIGVRGFLIVDESHNLKNPEAQRSSGIIKLSHSALRSIFISGTPLLNTPIELFSQVNALYPNIFDNYESFAFKYCAAEWTKYGLDVSGASNLEDLHIKLRDNLMVRRLKSDVLTQLPEKRRTTLYIDINSEKNNDTYFIEQATKDLEDIIKKTLISNGLNLSSTKTKLLSYNRNESGEVLNCKKMALDLYKLSGLSKLDFIKNWVVEKLDNEIDKLIIFGHHKEFLDGVAKSLEENDIRYMRIDGSTNKEVRFNLTEQFQTDNTIQVALLSINAASVGLTLTAASNVLMGEIPFTPGIALQAEDRVHRNGQKNGCNIYYALGNDTIDASLWYNLLRKNETSNITLDGGGGTTMDEDFELSNGILESLIMGVYLELKENNKVVI